MIFRVPGGVLIALLGVVALFIVDSITFAIAVILFMGVQIPSPFETTGRADTVDILGYFFDLRDGIKWLRGTVFAEIMFSTAITNFGSNVVITILPTFAAFPDVITRFEPRDQIKLVIERFIKSEQTPAEPNIVKKL